MKTGRDKAPRRMRGLLASALLAVGVLAVTSVPASAAVSSSFSNGVLAVNGDNLNQLGTASARTGPPVLALRRPARAAAGPRA